MTSNKKASVRGSLDQNESVFVKDTIIKKKKRKKMCFLDNLGQVLRGHFLTLACMVGNFCVYLFIYFFFSWKVEGNENFINTIYINTILLVIHTC